MKNFILLLFVVLITDLAFAKTITVAIIDTGADTSHYSLRNNLWTNTNEIPNNNIDDDKNGYIDDVHGWNFATNNKSLKDNHGHGTHIAGLVVKNNVKVRVMILKFYDPKIKKSNNMESTRKAFEYAIKMNVDIINYSAGGVERSNAEYKIIKKATDSGIVLVTAAGNESSNTDGHSSYYPANYKLNNIVSVGSINRKGKFVKSSNYGKTTVDILTVGKDVVSTVPNNKFGIMTGTSQATAVITNALSKEYYKDKKNAVRNLYKKTRHTTHTMNKSLYGIYKGE